MVSSIHASHVRSSRALNPSYVLTGPAIGTPDSAACQLTTRPFCYPIARVSNCSPQLLRALRTGVHIQRRPRPPLDLFPLEDAGARGFANLPAPAARRLFPIRGGGREEAWPCPPRKDACRACVRGPRLLGVCGPMAARRGHRIGLSCIGAYPRAAPHKSDDALQKLYTTWTPPRPLWKGEWPNLRTKDACLDRKSVV